MSTVADSVCARFNAAPYYQLLGMVSSSERPGQSRVVLPFREELVQLYGGIHGGALLSLADSALSVAVASTFERGETTATIDVAMSFLAPAGRRDLEARGSLLRRGKRIAFAECTIHAGDEVVARGHGTCYVSEG